MHVFRFLVGPACVALFSLCFLRGNFLEELDRDRFRYAACTSFIAGAVLLSIMSVARVLTLHATVFDLAIYEQRLWLTLHSQLLQPIRHHFSPILYLILPPFALAPSSFTPVLCQLLLYWLSVRFLFLYGADRLGSRTLGALVACAFVL